jgi:hypothetical protein
VKQGQTTFPPGVRYRLSMSSILICPSRSLFYRPVRADKGGDEEMTNLVARELRQRIAGRRGGQGSSMLTNLIIMCAVRYLHLEMPVINLKGLMWPCCKASIAIDRRSTRAESRTLDGWHKDNHCEHHGSPRRLPLICMYSSHYYSHILPPYCDLEQILVT